jgi:hypothetical protein
MPERKPHLRVERFGHREDYASRHRGRPEQIPSLDRETHGQALVGQYAAALAAYSQRRAAVTAPVTEETGLYLELTSMSGCKLPLESLDTARDYRLQSLHREGEAEVAVIFVPDSRRTVLQGKLQAYLNPQRDRSAQNPKPSNRRLVDSIAQIRLANLRSFWTDDLAFFPTDANESRWWELWLSKQGGSICWPRPAPLPSASAHNLATRRSLSTTAPWC